MHNDHPVWEQNACITTDFIELDKLLKRENLVASGGEAHALIGEGLVRVNGTVETRKRRKCMPGDLIELGRKRLRVVLAN